MSKPFLSEFHRRRALAIGLRAAGLTLATGLTLGACAPTVAPEGELRRARQEVASALQNPLDRLLLEERMRVLVLQRSRAAVDARQRDAIRLSMAGQLRGLGFPEEDVNQILSRVQESRLR